jgi:hypothetical protein
MGEGEEFVFGFEVFQVVPAHPCVKGKALHRYY